MSLLGTQWDSRGQLVLAVKHFTVYFEEGSGPRLVAAALLEGNPQDFTVQGI